MTNDPGAVLGPVTYDQWTRILARNVSADFEPHSRRAHRRYTVRGELKATWTHDGEPYTRTWQLTEVSSRGLSAKSYQEIPHDVAVNLEINFDGAYVPLQGRVMHCTQTLGGFKIGIRLHFPDA
jgi:hypothetical protein